MMCHTQNTGSSHGTAMQAVRIQGTRTTGYRDVLAVPARVHSGMPILSRGELPTSPSSAASIRTNSIRLGFAQCADTAEPDPFGSPCERRHGNQGPRVNGALSVPVNCEHRTDLIICEGWRIQLWLRTSEQVAACSSSRCPEHARTFDSEENDNIFLALLPCTGRIMVSVLFVAL